LVAGGARFRRRRWVQWAATRAVRGQRRPVRTGVASRRRRV
jgi:hypothetical protein